MGEKELYCSIDNMHFKEKGKSALVINDKKKKKTFLDTFAALGNVDLSENIVADIEEFTSICMVAQRINALIMC